MPRNSVSRRKLVLTGLGLSLLTGTIFNLAAKNAPAQEGERIRATFTVAYAGIFQTSGASFCGGEANGVINVEAHGAGSSNFGPLTFTLHKTVDPATGAAHGCLQLATVNGDTLEAIYDVNLGNPNDDHQFGVGTGGTLTFTGGTGRFQGARGSAALGSVFANFYPASPLVGQGVAVYTVDGTLSSQQ